MRYEQISLLKIDQTGAKVPDDGYTVRVPICTSASDPVEAAAILTAIGSNEALHAEPMALVTEPYHGRLVYVLAIEEHRYNPATAIEGTINEYVNGIIESATGPVAPSE